MPSNATSETHAGRASHDAPRDAEPPGERLGRELRARCVERLVHEWRIINWSHLRERLRPPVIELDQASSRWGSWCPTTRTIRIAERLVLGYQWASVIETLKHEMAHQVVDEVFRPGDVLPHGEAFRRACALLAIDPAATGDGGVPLTRRAANEAPEDARLRRIRGLLRLAESPCEHEAEAALAKAQELLLRHNLDLAATKTRLGYVVAHLGGRSRRRPRHVKVLAGLVSEHFFVEAIWVDDYDPRTGEDGRTLEVLGTAENVELAEHAWHEILRNADALWLAHQRATRCPGRDRQPFLDGVVSGYRARLRRERDALETSRELVWKGDPGLARFFRARHPRVCSDAVYLRGGDAYAAGREKGEDLRLTPGLKGGGGAAADRGRLLGHAGHS